MRAADSLPAPSAATASTADLRDLIDRYVADRGSLSRVHAVEGSPARRARLEQFYADWLAELARVDFDRLAQDGRVDYLLIKNHLNYEQRQLQLRAKLQTEIAPLVPFAARLVELEEARRRMEPVDAEKIAAALADIDKEVAAARQTAEAGLSSASAGAAAKKTVVNRAAVTIDRLRGTLRHWFGFYNGYDPVFTWWAEAPYKKLDQSLESYAAFLREKIVGLRPGDREAIVGDPIGREALLIELAAELISYGPEELLALAEREFAWCDAEMKRAARDMGHGDDWHQAMEEVKRQHVEPGKQPELIRKLALEAIEFLDARDLVTIPPLARETWRMEMMPPERQLVNPFFTGGEVITVSYPTSGMSHEQKLMTMRGNNVHFARATVFHELIPGHHLQIFMAERHRAYRRVFETPFLVEGWALYWEMLMWDLEFPKSPEDRIGMLFWRMHRCARIVLSLKFHLGELSPQECIDYLVERVGHERDNAAGEVRRWFGGDYPPLYQAAYMLGGLQLRALRRELVESGKMTNREFHDAVLKENAIPIELIRASLTGQPLARDFQSNWKFYGPEITAGPAAELGAGKP